MVCAEDINNLPVNSPVGTVVLGADPRNIGAVFVAGQLRKWDRQLVNHDVARIRELARSSLAHLVRPLAPEHGRRTLTGLRCEHRWEAPVRPEPRAQAAGLRAACADRERVIDLLKAAFVQGRLDSDEFDARIGQALAARTCGELAAVTAGIPAELTAALPRRPPVRARRRIPFNTAVTGGACMAGVVNAGMMAVLLSRSPVAVILFVVLTITGTILAIGAMIIAP
jgi:hypothetical protein